MVRKTKLPDNCITTSKGQWFRGPGGSHFDQTKVGEVFEHDPPESGEICSTFRITYAIVWKGFGKEVLHLHSKGAISGAHFKLR